jgi:hypothetical protein
MLGPGQCALGIHVSEGRLRVVALRGGDAGPSLAAVYDDAIPLVSVEHSGLIRDPHALATSVAAWAGQQGIDPSAATLSLAISGGSVLVRSLELAEDAASDVDGAVRAHVEHYSLFSMGDEVVGHEADEQEGPQGERSLQVTLAATSRQVAEPGWAMLQELRGRVQCVEASSLAACRAMAFAGELNLETAAPTMVLFLTSRRTEVLALSGRAVLFSHGLDLQLDDLVGAGDEAAATESYERVASEVARCVQFFQRQFRGTEPLQQILFVSDIPLADEFYEKVAAATGVAARASAPLAGVPAAQDAVPAAATDGAALAAAVGAALQAAEASEAFCIPLSIARVERRKVDLVALAKMLAPGVAILACFLLAAALTWSAARSAGHDEQFVGAQIAKELAGIRASAGGLTPEEKSHLLDSIEANKSLAAGGRATRPPEVIAALVSALPPGTSVEKLTIDKDGDISVTGTTQSEADAVALNRAFESADVIALARLSSLRVARTGDEAYVEFDIVASVR